MQTSNQSANKQENSSSKLSINYIPGKILLSEEKNLLLLLICALGITFCYLWYGTVQEHLFKMNPTIKDESITLFLLATGTFSSFLVALLWTIVRPLFFKDSDIDSNKNCDGNNESYSLNHPLFLLTSMTYLLAMAASNESLHYVSYPTCVLAKSSKLIPTIVVGWLVDFLRGRGSKDGAKSHSVMEWIGAALITVGIISFQWIQMHKQQRRSPHGGSDIEGDSPYGLALLGLSLFMDGILAACQNALKYKEGMKSFNKNSQKLLFRPPTAIETMLFINLYATLFLLPASLYTGQFESGLRLLWRTNNGVNDVNNTSTSLIQLNISASLGQVFIFLTIHHFSPVVCTTITTTRKFFTILLSVYRFGHVLDMRQWASVVSVFVGLYFEIVAKIIQKRKPSLDHEKDKNE